MKGEGDNGKSNPAEHLDALNNTEKKRAPPDNMGIGDDGMGITETTMGLTKDDVIIEHESAKKVDNKELLVDI